MKAVAIVSGGMDSTTLAYLMKDKGYDLMLLSFDYGQRHKKELYYAKIVADRLNAEHHIIDISGIQPLLKGSALTDNVDVPDGHYAEPSMKITIVPNRNAIMLSIAFGIASANKADLVGMAVHAGDHFIYPDCRPEFADAFQNMSNLSLDGCHIPKLFTPFISMRKQDIAMLPQFSSKAKRVGIRGNQPLERKPSQLTNTRLLMNKPSTTTQEIARVSSFQVIAPPNIAQAKTQAASSQFGQYQIKGC